jgi:thymidylate kinase
MCTIALIGPDGAGKTTVARRLEQALPVPVKYIYMGVNSSASNHLLPTTRLARWIKRKVRAQPDNSGPRDPDRPSPPRPVWKRVLRAPKSALSLVNRLAEEWYRQTLAWRAERRGAVVIFDRHYFSDFHAYDIARTPHAKPVGQRLHGWLLQRFYPRPDLVILLDAPGDVLLARKGEGTAELLERRRRDYLSLREIVKHFAVVDATRPADEVVAEVARRILEFHQLQCRAHSPLPNGAA